MRAMHVIWGVCRETHDMNRLKRIRQQRDTELESRQKIWRWLVVGALGVLIVETFWAGRAARHIAKAEVLA